MARTTFSGPVASDNGFIGDVTAGSVSATGNLTADSATAPAAGGMSAIQISSTANFGIYAGSGAPSITAAQGSLYLRTDGTTTNDRIYVRGSAAWIAITTAS